MAVRHFITLKDQLKYFPEEGAFHLHGIRDTENPTLSDLDRAYSATNIEFSKNGFRTHHDGALYFPVAMPDGQQIVKLVDFHDDTGQMHHLVVTLDHLYEYKNNIFYVVGEVIEDCEDVWTAIGGTTVDVDAVDYKEGTKSAIIACDGSGGIEAYETINFTWDAYNVPNEIAMWIKCGTTCAAGDYQLIMSKDAACATEDVIEDIPALVADTWTFVHIPMALVAGDNYIAIGLKDVVTDNRTFRFDSIRGSIKETSLISNPVTTCEIIDTNVKTIVINKQTDNILRFDGTTLKRLVKDAKVTRCKAVSTFENHLMFYGPYDGSAVRRRQIRWSNRNDYENGTDVNGINLSEHPGNLKGAISHEQGLLGFTEEAVFLGLFIGGSFDFNFARKVAAVGTPAINTVINTPYGTFFMGSHGVYLIVGLQPQEIGQDIEDTLFGDLNLDAIETSFALFDEQKKEYRLFVPGANNTYPNLCYTYHFGDGTTGWGIETISATTGGLFKLGTDTITIDQLSNFATSINDLTNFRKTIDALGGGSAGYSLMYATSTFKIAELDHQSNLPSTSARRTLYTHKIFPVGIDHEVRFKGVVFWGKGSAVDIVFLVNDNVIENGGVTFSSQSKLNKYVLNCDQTADNIQVVFTCGVSNWFDIKRFRVMYLDYED